MLLGDGEETVVEDAMGETEGFVEDGKRLDKMEEFLPEEFATREMARGSRVVVDAIGWEVGDAVDGKEVFSLG